MRPILLIITTISLSSLAAADEIHVPGDHPTIQAAIDASDDGDTVLVSPGVYTEQIDLLGKEITLRSTDGPEATTIDAAKLGRVVTCTSGETAQTIIEGFTIAGGVADMGGGMIIDACDPTVTDCVFADNRAVRLDKFSEASGGALLCIRSAEPLIENCQFRRNTADRGGGAIRVLEGAAPTVHASHFESNEADFGGAVAVRDGAPEFTDCVFADNTVNGDTALGGAVSNSNSTAIFVNCLFLDNHALGGGAVRQDSLSRPWFIGCDFIGNTATDKGGASVDYGSDPATFVDCMFGYNTAAFGGAIRSEFYVEVYNSHFFGNESENKGGALNSRWWIVAVNCIFTGNVAGKEGGAASGRMLALFNCTATGNEAVDDGGAFYMVAEGPHDVHNCVLWDNTPNEIGSDEGNEIVTYSNVQGGYTGEGNIDADPFFVDADGPDDLLGTEDDDLRLMPGSPCIDAGDNGTVGEDFADLDGAGDTTEPTPLDHAGRPRFVDDPETDDTGNGDPPLVDMGAYEFQVVICDGDLTGDDTVNLQDLSRMLQHFGDQDAEPDEGDLDGDGDVDLVDLSRLLTNFGTDCG